MKLQRSSDRSLLVYLGDEIGIACHRRVARLIRALEDARPSWLRNLNPGYTSVLVTFDALAVSHADVEAAIAELEAAAETGAEPETRRVEIPVCYGGEFGPDLEAVAAAHAIRGEEVVRVHTAHEYLAYFLGFAPGFAYLGDVPESIATPRHTTPRKSVPAGSVGIAGRQTGIYPFATPGGWQILGRTPLDIFRADRSPANRIQLGDRVRFRAIAREEFERLAAQAAAEVESARRASPAVARDGARMVIEKPGMLTTVQDAGREGLGPIGVSPSGAADPLSLAIGNRLLGNAAGAAALELTLTGGSFTFPEGARVALAGSDFGASRGGRALACWQAHEVLPGARIELGATRGGARAYLCVAGGIRVRQVMGSASTHLLSGIGGLDGRALRKGDVLEIGAAAPARARLINPGAFVAQAGPVFDPPGAIKRLRVTDGPQSASFSPRSWSTFLESTFTVTEDANRMGLRLDGPTLSSRMSREMISEGVSLGAIQITPAGQPIVLFVEQQTAGGYPKIANLVSADVFRLGQLRPRDRVRFERVPFDEAIAAWREQQTWLASDGIFAA